ncbi:FadR/GntR family transcriptional regulator [Consotaella aegiceratis]|uniref:FadR/GntR family transcriptional regulator n=1 Tax=Consotaella aegiceratis TaxID=3097961 RepID=UPI002F3F82BC
MSAALPCSDDAGLTKLERTIARFGFDIVSGRYGRQGALPSEAELCGLYEVSRATLREVIKVLGTKRLIDIQKHRGLFIEPRRRWNYLDTDVLHWALSAEDPYDLIQTLLETRAVIEPAIAEWAAMRADASDLAKMEAAVDEMDRCYQDKQAFNAADIRFHQALIASAQNFVVEQLGEAIEALQTAVFDVTYFPDAETKEITISQHRQLYDSIRLRKPATAKRISVQMIAGVRSRIDGRYGRSDAPGPAKPLATLDSAD